MAGVPVAGDEPQRYGPHSPPLWIPAPYRSPGHAFDRENDEAGSRIEDIGRPVHGGRYQAGVVAAGGFSPKKTPMK